MGSALIVLQGGLGNQLFQLATALDRGPQRGYLDARLLSQRNQGLVTMRNFELAGIAQQLGWRVGGADSFALERVYRPLVNRVGSLLEDAHFRDFVIVVRPNIGNGPANGEGGDRLFDAIHDWLGERLVPRREGQAVHLRLGDYRKLTSTYGEPDPEYYLQSITQHFDPSEPVHVFSDEPAEAHEWFSELAPDFEFQLPNLLRFPNVPGSWPDLLQMATQRRLIAGNSTYSWWAAWLQGRAHGVDCVAVVPRVMPVTGLRAPRGCTSIEWKVKKSA